jgi:hypothetical protein
MLEIRATSLERYSQCPYKFKHGESIYGNRDNLIFWTITHKYIQTFLKNNEDPALALIVADRSIVDRKKIHRMALMVQEYIKDKWYTYIMDELTLTYMCDDDSLYLEGTFDILVTDEEKNYILLDLKTAKSERSEEQIKMSKQKKIYPFLLKRKIKYDIKEFHYLVLTKHSIPRLQVVEHIVEDDNDEQILELIDKYRQSEEQNIRPAQANFGCNFCSLRKNGTCPLYSKSPF